MIENLQKTFDFYVCSGKLGNGKRKHLYIEYKKDLVNHVIGINIKRLRIKNNMSIEELSNLLNRSRRYSFEMETGRLNISMYHIMKLSVLFDVPLTYFFQGLDKNDYIL